MAAANPHTLPTALPTIRDLPAEETTTRQFAMKRMTKASAMQCPEHVYAEKEITKNLLHPFCLRQYASFQVGFGGQVLGRCVTPARSAPVVSLVRWLCCGQF